MAIVYVRSGASGAANGTSWTDAYTTLTAAGAAAAAGDDIYVAHDHAENAGAAAITTAFTNSSNTNPMRVICVNTSTGLTATTATITNTSGNQTYTGANVVIYGITFNVSSGATTGSLVLNMHPLTMHQCNLNLNNTSASSTITIGANNGNTDFFNVNIAFSNISQDILTGGPFRWRGGGVVSHPTNPVVVTELMTQAGSKITTLLLEGLDLSIQTGAGKTLFNHNNNSSSVFGAMVGCKIGATIAIVDTLSWNSRFDVISCDSGTNFLRNETYTSEGTMTSDATAYMNGGATDGVTPYSHKYVTVSSVKALSGFDGMPFTVWNDTTGSKTITVELATSGLTLTDSEVALELFYQGSSSETKMTRVSTLNSNFLGAGTNLTSSSATWTGIASATAMKISTTVNVQQKGLLRGRIRVFRPSTTLWVNPDLIIT